MALTISNKPKRKDPMQAFFEGADEEQLQGGAPGTAFQAYRAAGGRGPITDVLDAFDAAAQGQKIESAFQVADRIAQAMAGTGGATPVTTTDGDDPPLPTPASTTTTTPTATTTPTTTTTPTATTAPTIDEGALLNEVMGAIRSDPMRFKSSAGLMDYRTSGGLSLNQLPQSVQDAFNTFRGGGEYNQLLSQAEGRDPAIQLQRANEWRAEQDRIAREAAADAALRAQQAELATQNSTAAIEQASGPIASDVTNAASFTEGIPLQAEVITAPTANPNTGLNPAINYQLAETARLDLPSNDELRRNQMALLAEMQNQAEDAGKSAVEGLTLPDLTAVSVPPRQLSAMEQALDTRLTDRLTGGRFLDPQSALTNEAEAQALERLQKRSFLGDSAALDAAERRAMTRMEDDALLGTNEVLDAARAKALGRLDETGRGVALDSDLMTDAEALIRQRLLGGESPAMAAQRARIEERYGESMDEGRELLNRLGVLRGGDSADIFNELTRGRDQQMLDVDALGYDLQTQALQDALGYQGRRDALGLANQELARAAIADVAGIGAQYDQRALAEQGLQRGAISDVAGLAGQRAERDLAEQALRRQAIADTLPFQERRDTLALAEQDLQRAAISDAMERQGAVDQRDLAESQLTGSVRGAATLPARMAQAGLQFDAARLQQDVADRTLARLLTQTEPTQRELFEEGVRATREQERLFTEGGLADMREQDILNQELQRELARSQSRRAEQLQEAELFGEIAGLGSDPTLRRTLSGRRFEQDVLNQELQRQLARAADLRAGQVQEAELFGEVAGEGSAPARATRQALQDALAQAAVTGRLDGEETMAGRALASDLLSAEQQRLLQRQAQDAELFGEVAGVGADPTVRRTRAAEMDAFNQALARAGLTGTFEGEKTQDALTNELQRQLARSADLRAAQAQEADLFGEVSGVGSDPTMRPTRQATMDAFNQELARAGLTGTFEGEQTMAQKAMDFDKLVAEAGLTGKYKDKDTVAQKALEFDKMVARAGLSGQYEEEGGVLKDTMAKQAMEFDKAMAQAGLSGQYEEDGVLKDTMAKKAMEFDKLVAEAGLTGMYDEEKTVAQKAMEAQLTGKYDEEKTLAREAMEFDKLVAEAGLRGTYEGDKTVAQQAMEAQLTGMYDDKETFQRLLAEAELTGMYGEEKTAAQKAMEAQLTGMYDDKETFQRLLAEAELTGRYGEEDTLRKALAEAELTGRYEEEDTFQKALAEAGITGRYGEEDTLQKALAEAGITGRYGEEDTLQKALAEAGLTGKYGEEETLAREAMEFDKLVAEAGLTGMYNEQDTFQKALAEAGLTGMYGDEETMAKEAMEFEKDIAEAGLTGTYGEDPTPTMAREAMDLSQRNQLISQILAAGDKSLEGRLDPLATHLASELSGGDFDLNMALWQSLNPGMAQGSYNPPPGYHLTETVDVDGNGRYLAEDDEGNVIEFKDTLEGYRWVQT